MTTTESTQTAKAGSPWESTSTQYLIRYRPSGVYFAKFKVGGKQFRFSLETTVRTVAQVRLVEERKKRAATAGKATTGRLTFGDAVALYRERFQADQNLKRGTKGYKEETLLALQRTWPGLWEADLAKITEKQCQEWARRYAADFSATRFNGTLTTLRHVFEIGIKEGVRHENPVLTLKRQRVRAKKLTLPSRQEFTKLVEAMEKAGGRDSRNCANFVRFLAFTGCRKGEAAKVTWGDVEFKKGRIAVRGDAETGTKNWEVRHVPMIDECRTLLENLRAERPEEPDTAPVMLVRECQASIDRASRKTGIVRISHHDFRHLFATRCIESGVDIPTVSRWLGHKDGGALAMKTYGHLRDEHSTEMAMKVKF